MALKVSACDLTWRSTSLPSVAGRCAIRPRSAGHLYVKRRKQITVDEPNFKQLLDQHAVAVVHFSHHAVMGHKVEFPQDLNHALDNYETETRSCCAVFPGHRMNLPGSVGVLFELKYSHVLSVCRIDSGSSDFGGVEGSMGEAPTEQAILDSLAVSDGSYNEWRIRGAKPTGIFVENPRIILVKKAFTLDSGIEQITDIGCKSISLAGVFAAFPELPVYTMGGHKLEELLRPTSV